MKICFPLFCFILFISCSPPNDIDSECPKELKDKEFCELYNEAKWMFYASNSHGKFEYVQNDKTIICEDILSLNLTLDKVKASNDTIELSISFDSSQVQLYSLFQMSKFYEFGFSKKTRKLIYRKRNGVEGDLKKENGYIFYNGDSICRILENASKNNSGSDMRIFGIYPIDEQEKILINKIGSNRKDINPWLINYAKKKGYVK